MVATWVVAAELYRGAANSQSPKANLVLVDAFLEPLDVLRLDRETALRFGEAKAHLVARGKVVGDADLLIAAVALARGAVILTGNARHFARIPGAATEDWIRR